METGHSQEVMRANTESEAIPFLFVPFEKIEFPKFNSTIKCLAIMYQKATGNDGDICFNGPACKNPFYEGFESYVSFNVASKQSIVETVESFQRFVEHSNLYLYHPQ